MSPLATVTASPGLDPGCPASRREIAALAERVLTTLDLPEAELELHLVDDRRMAAIHRDFMGRTGPTNILSFPDEDPARPRFIGHAILSIDTLLREADLYGQDPATHLTRLLAHSILHLAGLDHGPEMDQLTDTTVATLGPRA